MIATEHLLELGHRRIGFLAGRPDLESARLRERGYRTALERAGIEVDPSLIRVGGYQVDTAVGGRATDARAGRSADGDLRCQRRVGDRGDVGREVARPRGARRPVGDRLRQRPRVGAQRAAADDDRAADPADGLRGREDPDSPDRRDEARPRRTRCCRRGSSSAAPAGRSRADGDGRRERRAAVPRHVASARRARRGSPRADDAAREDRAARQRVGLPARRRRWRSPTERRRAAPERSGPGHAHLGCELAGCARARRGSRTRSSVISSRRRASGSPRSSTRRSAPG